MKVNLKNKLALIAIINLFSLVSNAQSIAIDKIIAVVGENIILYSELEAQLQQFEGNKQQPEAVIRCKVLEDLLYQKLLVAQAKLDSIEIADEQVNQELERRMNYYLKQFGSEEKFQAFYGKSSGEMKEELRDNVKDLLLAQQMQSKIISDISATPSDVKNYFKSIPADSLPYINMEVEVGQIVKKPSPSAEAQKEAKQKIEQIRERIIKKESTFSTMAALYSEDPGSASKGGLYEGVQRGQFVPEWEAWAFKLKPDEVSEVFETMYGYFIIQLIARRGNEVDARSLLIAPKVDFSDALRAKKELDNVYNLLLNDSISFEDAAAKYSDEGETKYNSGLIVNPFVGSTRFQLDELGQYDQNAAFAIEKLTAKQFTTSLPTTTHDGKQAYRILYLKSRTQPHIANLEDDYQTLQSAALAKKQEEAINLWVKKKIAGVYINISEEYKTCNYTSNWLGITN